MRRMAMGKRRHGPRQPSIWIAAADLPRRGDPFYERLNHILDGRPVRCVCRGGLHQILCAGDGPSGSPAQALLPAAAVGYFEGIDSERGIAWRATDSLAVRSYPTHGYQQRQPSLERGAADQTDLKNEKHEERAEKGTHNGEASHISVKRARSCVSAEPLSVVRDTSGQEAFALRGKLDCMLLLGVPRLHYASPLGLQSTN